MKTSQLLKECKCGRTFHIKQSKNENVCDTCFEKSEKKRLQMVSMQNANKVRTAGDGDIEKIADFVE